MGAGDLCIILTGQLIKTSIKFDQNLTFLPPPPCVTSLMSVSYNRFYKWTFINDITQREEKGLVFCYSSVHMALSIGVLEGVQETAQICVTSFMNDS